MQALSTYRNIQVEAACPKFPRPLSWEQHTTRPDDELRSYATTVVNKVCAAEDGPTCAWHEITITEIPQTSTGSRRG